MKAQTTADPAPHTAAITGCAHTLSAQRPKPAGPQPRPREPQPEPPEPIELAGLAASRARAKADLWVCRSRFHTATIHRTERPQEPCAAALFDALEQARVLTLGGRRYPGLALNGAATLQSLAPARDALRLWMAAAALDEQAPNNPSDPWAPALAELRPLLTDQARFAATAAALIARLPLPDIAVQATTTAPGEVIPMAAEDAAAEDDEAAALVRPDPGQGSEQIDHGDHYRVYTRAYDRELQPADLAGLADCQQRWHALEARMAGPRKAMLRLARRLQRAIQARQRRHWSFDLEEGLLDGARLARLVTRPGDARCFKLEADSPWPATAVTLLIDNSGSMKGKRIDTAAMSAAMLAEALERVGVRVEIAGFTTASWDGGQAREAWQRAGSPPHPGRLGELLHILYKTADTPYRRARPWLGLMSDPQLLKENLDGEALAWAHRRLLARPEPRRLLIVISDGAPADEATHAVEDPDYLVRHLRGVIDDIEQNSPVGLAAIGIVHDVHRYYRRAVSIMRVEELATALDEQLLPWLEGR